MTAITEMRASLRSLESKSQNETNKRIYHKILDAFASDSEQNINRIVDGIVLMVHLREEIQEAAITSYMYKASRKGILESSIKAIIVEYIDKPEFITIMSKKIETLKKEAQAQIEAHKKELDTAITSAQEKVSAAQKVHAYWRSTSYGQIRVEKGISCDDTGDDIIHSEYVQARKKLRQCKTELKIAENHKLSSENVEHYFKISAYLSELFISVRNLPADSTRNEHQFYFSLEH